jgi:hypothetical protein
MDFQEAERRFRELRRQYDAGMITSSQFDEQREQLKVQDQQGRWWAKGRGEDDWYFHDGRTWVRANPPVGGGTRGARVQPPENPPGNVGVRPPGASVPGYLLPASIAATLLCCLPTGIVAIIYSTQASSKSQIGDTAGASQAVSNANTWLIVSLVGGVLFYFLVFALGASGA